MAKLLLVPALTVLMIFSAVAHAESYLSRAEVDAYIEELIQQHNFSRPELEEVLAAAERRQDIIDLMRRPAERRLNWHEYSKIFLDEQRIAGGVEFWQQNQATLERAQKEYGVAPEVIVAIIGVETRYGRVTGRHRVVDALMTLAFDYPPRASFFRKELTQFLLLAREEGKNPISLTGSYAGAMGFGQFIPSSYRSYAVDFDQDGVRDIWQNRNDAIGSVANYFSRHGWRGAEQVTLPVQLKAETEQLLSIANQSLKPTHSIAEMAEMGVIVDGLDPDARVLLLRLLGGEKPEYWLGFDDFYVITRYNHSRLYAMAVYQLGQEIVKRRKQSIG
ncbi:MAG TPA: lytic murein transglycosylase B [Gammaproteobacteria bacterium]|jgi:membrane-bound lytic murein transglycosylase B|nr:lytic murein transglycosylase B [Gammaproteobacteria bacterium]|tara:strand:+ start:368 stop:1366 length:999 start_codon:yes stop_codon:yes gene_type:complete